MRRLFTSLIFMGISVFSTAQNWELMKPETLYHFHENVGNTAQTHFIQNVKPVSGGECFEMHSWGIGTKSHGVIRKKIVVGDGGL